VRLEIARNAEIDLARIRAYIRQENPTAARRVVAGILDGIQVLVTYPDIGRPGRIGETRELVLTGLPYIVCYATDSKTVSILRVLHGSQQWIEEV
jgi:plasmid stabilization system protein ParE